jgi:hypothetical protein
VQTGNVAVDNLLIPALSIIGGSDDNVNVDIESTASTITSDTIDLLCPNTCMGIQSDNQFIEISTGTSDFVFMDFHSKGDTSVDYSARLSCTGGAVAGTGDVALTCKTINLGQHDRSTKRLELGGTLVTATAAELNLLDGVTNLDHSGHPIGYTITTNDTDLTYYFPSGYYPSFLFIDTTLSTEQITLSFPVSTTVVPYHASGTCWKMDVYVIGGQTVKGLIPTESPQDITWRNATLQTILLAPATSLMLYDNTWNILSTGDGLSQAP